MEQFAFTWFNKSQFDPEISSALNNKIMAWFQDLENNNNELQYLFHLIEIMELNKLTI